MNGYLCGCLVGDEGAGNPGVLFGRAEDTLALVSATGRTRRLNFDIDPA